MIKAIQFHRVTPKFQYCGTWNYPLQFEKFIDFIRRDVEVVLPGQGSSGVVISFDDGDKSVYDYAFPILKKYGIRALVFLIVDYVGREDVWDLALAGRRSAHLSWEEIYKMRDWGIEFGSHTMSHRNLTKLSGDEVAYEIAQSKRVLEKRIGPVSSISYPFNRVNHEVVSQVERAGYQFGFGGRGEGNLLIKKEAVYITDNVHSLGTKILEHPRCAYQCDRMKQQVINYFTIATMLVKR